VDTFKNQKQQEFFATTIIKTHIKGITSQTKQRRNN
jgi:hypothetical protein